MIMAGDHEAPALKPSTGVPALLCRQRYLNTLLLFLG
jgi:hypothetical protein